MTCPSSPDASDGGIDLLRFRPVCGKAQVCEKASSTVMPGLLMYHAAQFTLVFSSGNDPKRGSDEGGNMISYSFDIEFRHKPDLSLSSYGPLLPLSFRSSSCRPSEIRSAQKKSCGFHQNKTPQQCDDRRIDMKARSPTGRFTGPVLMKSSQPGIDRKQITLLIATGIQAQQQRRKGFRLVMILPADIKFLDHDAEGDMVTLPASCSGAPAKPQRGDFAKAD